MKSRRRLLRVAMSVLVLVLCPSPASAGSSEWDQAEQITRDRVGRANAALQGGGAGKRLVEMAEKASADSQVLAELYQMQGEYVDRATGAWRDGTERQTLREALSRLQSNAERTSSALRMATEAAEAASTRIRQSGVIEKAAELAAAAKEAAARLAARWERERAQREREREQREREAGERAREERR